MAFRAPNQYIRERILSMGGAGTGKSLDFYTIVYRSLQTKSEAEFHIVDSDNSAHRMMVDPRFKGLLLNDDTGLLHPQIHVYPVIDWVSLMDALEKIGRVVKPIDWANIDMITPSYEWAQGDYVNRAFGKDLDDYFIEVRKSRNAQNKKAGMNSFEGIDWNIIKPIFARLSTAMINWPSHLYATAEVKALDTERADKATKATFGPHGVQPVGQKSVPFWFSTILWKTQTVSGWEIVTIKDRSRAMLEGSAVEDFSRDYLMKVANWKPL